MTYENPHPIQINTHAISAPTSSGVWAWLFWLRQWLCACYGGKPDGFHKSTRRGPQAVSRANRLENAHFTRCALPPARNLTPLRALQPRGLSPTQSLERLARISVWGRVALYNIPSCGSVLLRRALLICYDHGWWRAPARGLRARQEPASLRPP